MRLVYLVGPESISISTLKLMKYPALFCKELLLSFMASYSLQLQNSIDTLKKKNHVLFSIPTFSLGSWPSKPPITSPQPQRTSQTSVGYSDLNTVPLPQQTIDSYSLLPYTQSETPPGLMSLKFSSHLSKRSFFTY